MYDEKYSTMSDKLHVAADIAHEQAHQWFGDWVTMQWWENTWLNEGFAAYFEYHALARMQDGTILGVCYLVTLKVILKMHRIKILLLMFINKVLRNIL